MGDLDCGDCDCDCDDCCDCDNCCDCDGCCASCKDCGGCCNIFSAFTCAHCCSDFLEFICCENTSNVGNNFNSTNQQRREQQRHAFQDPHHELICETSDEVPPPFDENFPEPGIPSAPPPSYNEVVQSQPLPNGVEPAIVSQPGYAINPSSSRI